MTVGTRKEKVNVSRHYDHSCTFLSTEKKRKKERKKKSLEKERKEMEEKESSNVADKHGSIDDPDESAATSSPQVGCRLIPVFCFCYCRLLICFIGVWPRMAPLNL